VSHVHAETARLVLRRFTEEDAADLYALDSDPEVMRHVGPPLVDGVAASLRAIRERFLPYYERRPGYGFWVAEEKATGAFLGWFHLRPALDYRFAAEAGYQEGEVDLGYRLRRAAWGRGYATEGSRALVDRAFSEQPPEAVVSCALEVNGASIRVMEKVGLKRVGWFRLPGYDNLLVRYALTRAVWASRCDTAGRAAP
jgi:RimJ/RimL family protein N-acetyltransferase